MLATKPAGRIIGALGRRLPAAHGNLCVWYTIGESQEIRVCSAPAPYLVRGNSICELHVREALTGQMGIRVK